MIIKFIKQKEIEKGGYEFIQIVGEKNDNTTYTKDFPSWDEELVGQLEGFKSGDFMNLSYKQDKYKNLKGIKAAEGFSDYKSKGGGSGKKSQGTSNKNTGKGGDWIQRGTDNNRASAMYLAKDIVIQSIGKKAIPAEELTTRILGTANVLLKYVLEGRNLIEEAKVQDGLKVPDIDTNTKGE